MGTAPSADSFPDVEVAEVPNSINVIILSMARRVSSPAAPGVDCNEVGVPREECRGDVSAVVGAEYPEACPTAVEGVDDLELLDSSLSP